MAKKKLRLTKVTKRQSWSWNSQMNKAKFDVVCEESRNYLTGQYPEIKSITHLHRELVKHNILPKEITSQQFRRWFSEMRLEWESD